MLSTVDRSFPLGVALAISMLISQPMAWRSRRDPWPGAVRQPRLVYRSWSKKPLARTPDKNQKTFAPAPCPSPAAIRPVSMNIFAGKEIPAVQTSRQRRPTPTSTRQGLAPQFIDLAGKRPHFPLGAPDIYLLGIRPAKRRRPL